VFLAAGCSFYARDADAYRKVTREVLETKSQDLKGCYDAQLRSDPKVAGSVVVKFTVQKETGKIINPTLDAASTAPDSLRQCVLHAIDGLAIDPPDKRDGAATFRWDFELNG
jgi:hypothetical protein